MRKIIVSMTALILASCVNNDYIEPDGNDVSYIAISTLGQELPSFKITSGCKSSILNVETIENRSPIDEPSKTIKVSDGVPLTISYNYSWFGAEISELRNFGGGRFGENTRIENRQVKQVETCNKQITFVPEANESYEVFFSVVSDKCTLKVARSHNVINSIKQKLSKVNLVEVPSC